MSTGFPLNNIMVAAQMTIIIMHPPTPQVGLPAKSGVSGAVLLVVPNVMGVMCWSPPLDRVGNSVRGIHFCQVGTGFTCIALAFDGVDHLIYNEVENLIYNCLDNQIYHGKNNRITSSSYRSSNLS